MPQAVTTTGKDENSLVGSIGQPSAPIMQAEAVTVPPLRFWLLSVAIYIGLFLSIMDAIIVASSLHAMALQFKVFTAINWVALAYTLAECSCGAVFARISDVVGRQNAFTVANMLFFVFSLACGFAQNLEQLVAFRTLQGVGGAGLYSMTMVILPEVCPDHLLPYASAFAGASIVVAFIVGPILGGVLTQYASWRWIFWVNGPICVMSMVFLLFFWPKEEYIVRIVRQQWKSFDYLGSILLIAATVLIVLSFQNVGVSTNDIWNKAVFFAPIVVGLVCWGGLFIWEYVVEYRLSGSCVIAAFPLSLFRNRFYASAVASTLLLGFPLFVLIFSVPLRAQLVSDKSPLVAATELLPMLGAAAAGCVLTAAFNAKRNYYSECISAGASLSLIGCALLTTISESKDDKSLLGYLALVGLGAGLSIASSTGSTALEIPPRSYAPAQGLMAQARVLGGSFGISATSVFFRNEVARLAGVPLSPELLSLLGDAESNLPNELRAVVREGCSRAFQKSMVAAAAISGVAILLTLIGFRRAHKNTKQQRVDLVLADDYV